MISTEARLAPGTRVCGGQIEVVEELARGGMAIVYRAIDHDLGVEVALKVVSLAAIRSETTARFENEARLGASLSGHPHVVRPLSVGQLDGPKGFEGRMYLVTELVVGTDLDFEMRVHRTGLPALRACRIARDVARALTSLHERGIVHRDIKPGNVLLTGCDEAEHAKIIDFGLAYATGDGWEAKSPDLTQDGHAPGTALYMSAQQLAHERPKAAFDIFSFGVMLYEMFSGDPPYDRYPLGEIIAYRCDPKRKPYPIAKMCSELPIEMTTLVDRCMSYEPDSRPSAAELVRALDEILGERTAVQPTAVRRGGWIFTLAATAAVAVGVVAFYWWPGDGRLTEESTAAVAQPARAAASYAKVDAADGSEALDAESSGTGDPEAMGSTSTATGPTDEPGAGPSDPTQASVRSAPRPAPAPEVDRCSEEVRAARAAAKRSKWTRVLQLTKKRKCWKPDALDERTRFRTQALFETGRYAECAQQGQGSNDGRVARWAKICKANVESKTP